ncbi:hypothetical protein [Sphingomonas morindae]|uniref:Porin n=1 Tax=Sphingomonas morindae TaxID=1541170 RepID=A0ABY4X5B8_9SPHN|nr:hypothetical protein [Sphingomonas morindae]USI72071.1 hypothetical protein LHA26_12240 [Sphingomonas morindae]
MSVRSWVLAGAATMALMSANAAVAAPKHRASGGSSATTRELMDQVRALRAQVEALQTRLDGQATQQAATQSQVEAQQAQVQSAIQAQQAQVQTSVTQVAQQQAEISKRVDKVEHPDKFAFKGITITPGGFLELAGIYRQHQMANDIATGFNSIPYPNTRTGYTQEARFTARQSRVSLLAEGDANKRVHLAMYGEFDFQGAARTANSNESNSFNPRIRNLYGTVDWRLANGNGLHFLAGQNWSLATMNSKGITPRNELTPPQIDAQYVPGFVWTRQPGVRLTADLLDKHLWLAVAVENPQTTFFTNGTGQGAMVGSNGTAAPLPASLTNNIAGGSGFDPNNNFSLNHVPDVIGKIAYEASLGGHGVHLEGFGIYRDFYDRVSGSNQDVTGWGVGGGIVAQLVPGVLDAQFSGLYGKGVGRYGTSQLPDVTFGPDGRISAIREYMLLAGATLHATKMLDIYGFAGEEISKGRYFTTAAGQLYGYGNPLYTNYGCYTEGSGVCNGNTRAIKQITFGFWQKLYQGSFGRAQVGAQYSLTRRESFDGLGANGLGFAPRATQNIGFLSFRYYPF